MVVGVSTAILGGTLVFLERVAPHPSQPSVMVLGGGWLLLFLAILAISYVRRQNLESLRRALRGEYDVAKGIDIRTRRMSTAAPILMVAGMALVAYSGLMNLWPHQPEGDRTMTKTPRERHELPLSISSGDTGPKKPAAPVTTPAATAKKPTTGSPQPGSKK